MEKYITTNQIKVILDNAPKDVDKEALLRKFDSNGYKIQGYNDQPVVEEPKQDGIFKTIAKDVAGTLAVNPISRATEAITRTVAPNSLAAKGYEQFAEEGQGQNVLGVNVPTVTGGKQITGEALKTASYLFPYGKAAGLAGKGVGKIAGNVASGATGGYLADAGFGLTDPNQTTGEALTPGMGTAIGGAIPLAGPALRATGRATAKLGGKAVETVIPNSVREAQILQTYKANNPFFKRVADVLKGTEKAPTTAGKTATTEGLIGTKSGIGVQATRASQKLWEDIISPRLKASEQAVDLDGFFSKIENDIIESTPEIARQNSLLKALNSFKEDYAGINSVSLEKLQKLKEGWAEFVPEKFYKGENISGAANQVRGLLANESRQTIYSQLGDDVKQAYFDYGNLQGLKKMGQVSMTGAKLKGGTGGLVSEIFSQAITPIGTVGGQAIYKLGKGIEFIGNLGAKNLGEALGIQGGLKFPGDKAVDDIGASLKKVNKLPNKQGGFIKIGQDTSNIKSLLKTQLDFDAISTQKSNVLRKFAGENGLIPDSVKNNPEYLKASIESKKALQDLQKFNMSSEGKKLQSEMKKLGVVERQQLRKSLSQDANLPTATQTSQTTSKVKSNVIPKSSPKSPTKSIDLTSEAKKYKSAEEFATSNEHIFDRSGELVKVGDKVDFSYGGSEFKGKLVKVNNFDGSYETTSAKGKEFRDYSPEVTVEATENIYNKGGFLVHKKGDKFKVNAINLNEYKDNYSPIKTKSQLTEIWNKANKK